MSKKEDKQRLDSILKSIEKIKSERKVEKRAEEKDDKKLVDDKEEDLSEVSLGEKVNYF